MQRDLRAAGFTLIELLVVIAILGLLIATFAPDIFGARLTARIAADQAQLRWHYQQFINYQGSHKGLPPPQTGHKFVLAPWVYGTVQRTEENFRKYWLPETQDPRMAELATQDPEQIWRSFDDLNSDDTHYAGPGPENARQRLLENGKLAIMADDNEFGPSWENFTINVLLGGGTAKAILVEELQQYGWDPDQADGKAFEVGPSSPHPLLQKLER